MSNTKKENTISKHNAIFNQFNKIVGMLEAYEAPALVNFRCKYEDDFEKLAELEDTNPTEYVELQHKLFEIYLSETIKSLTEQLEDSNQNYEMFAGASKRTKNL